MADLPTESIFHPFNISHHTYKTLSTHPIRAAILTPKTLPPGTHPVAINIHGGYLVCGHRTFPPFFHPWLLRLSLTHNTIIVSADHRLLPTPNGLKDINTDLEHFWTWLHGPGFRKALSESLPGVTVDFGRTLVVGGSAGGYGALQLALAHPSEMKMVAGSYPMVDLRGEFWVNGPREGAPTPVGLPLESIMSREDTEAWIEEGLKRAGEGEMVSEGGGLEMVPVGVALAWHGLFWRLFDPKGEVGAGELPVEMVRAGGKLPRKVWIVHGDADSTVPVEGSRVFAGLVREMLPGTEMRLDTGEGKDHGFDLMWKEDDEWARERLAWLVQAWLKV
ncbi:MAG: hypothetical protein MMC23_005473 [Stictis urceolatum]|nr:hypothetical protein [Stictis urceolata]